MFSDVLLTVDYDRTLTATDSTIPQRNIEAIEYFMANGGTFTVNTGRTVPAIASFRDVVSVNAPFLVYNGAAWYDRESGELNNLTTIELEPEQVVAELLEKFPDLTVEIQGVESHYCVRKNLLWEKYEDNNGFRWAYTDLHNIPRPFIKFAIYGKFLSDRVASLYEATEEERQYYNVAVDYVQNRWGDKLDVFWACARLIDFQAKGVSKIASARKLQKALGKKILVCAGDAENDIPMLDGADYAYCPADGVVADRYENVCNCNEGAIADVIYKKIPEILGICLDRTE